MSRLSVYWPDECEMATRGTADAPMILPFPTRMQSAGATAAAPVLDVVTRARLLFENRKCCQCGYPVVEPLELDDALLNSNGREVPGTATLIGFECRSCHASWSI